MLQKTVEDIIAYLDFLQTAGYAVSVRVLDKTLDVCHASFTSQRPNCGHGAERLVPIRYGERSIARICVLSAKEEPKHLSKETVHALTAPLVYMFERLYEQCREYSEQNTAEDAYHKSLVFIRNHFMEGISVADVAKGIGYSASYFGYVFKKNCGISVNKYICELQLLKAAELLRDTTLSVSDVAGRVGFGDANYFSTVFKARFALSPREYRQENKK